MNAKQQRQFSAYEKNHLSRYGINKDLYIDSEMPVEYITGNVNFLSRDFIVDKNVLIPRIETEELIKLILEKLKNNFRILDMGTGSGAIGITLQLEAIKKQIQVEIILCDISLNALRVAEANIDRLVGNNKKISLIRSDLFIKIPLDIKFDIIVANLPYIPNSRMNDLDESVRNFEPHLALNGGEKGLEIIEKFLVSALNYLNKSGYIFLEIDESQTLEDFHNIFSQRKLAYKATILQDSFKRNRFAIITVI